MGNLNLKTGSNNKKLTIIVVLVSVIVILNAVLLVIYLKKDKDTNPTTASQAQDSVGSSNRAENPIALDTISGQDKSGDKVVVDQHPQTYAPPQSSYGIPGNYPQASQRLLTYADIKGMHVWDVIVMRNEIYARYGHIFTKSWELREYFSSQSWYRPISTSVENQLTQLEKRNVQFLLEHTPKYDMNNIRGSNTYVR